MLLQSSLRADKPSPFDGATMFDAHPWADYPLSLHLHLQESTGQRNQLVFQHRLFVFRTILMLAVLICESGGIHWYSVDSDA